MPREQRYRLRPDQRRQLIVARESLGLSGRGASESLGWAGYAQLRRIESGERDPTLERLRQLCELYSLTLTVRLEIEIETAIA